MNTIKRTSRSESKWSIVQNTAMKSVAVLVLLHLAIGNEINTSQTGETEINDKCAFITLSAFV